MAALDEASRIEVWARFMRRNAEELGLTKQDLKDAVDAIDTWIDDNSTNFNNALPLPARTSLSQTQKVLAFVYVLDKRYEVL